MPIDLPFLSLALPEFGTVLYAVQAGTYGALAATPEGAHSHRRICLCHVTAAAIYAAFGVVHALHL